MHGKIFMGPDFAAAKRAVGQRYQQVSVVRALGVSVVDLLDADTVVIAEDALQRLSEVLVR